MADSAATTLSETPSDDGSPEAAKRSPAPRGLGKGLGALIPQGISPPETPDSPQSAVGFGRIDISLIDPNPDQPRTRFDEESLAFLADSIREIGILQPLVVRPKGSRYQLVAGERRWRAAQSLGLSEVPAVIREKESQWSNLTEALVENIQREDLGPLEEAAAYRQLLEDFGWTHDDLAARVGKARPTITNALRLLALPASIQGYLERGELTAAHAKELASATDPAYAELLARRAAAEGWSVRMLRDALATRAVTSPVVTGRNAARPAEIIAYEERLNELLGSTVKIAYSGSRGSIKVKFSSMDELANILAAIEGPPTRG